MSALGDHLRGLAAQLDQKPEATVFGCLVGKAGVIHVTGFDTVEGSMSPEKQRLWVANHLFDMAEQAERAGQPAH